MFCNIRIALSQKSGIFYILFKINCITTIDFVRFQETGKSLYLFYDHGKQLQKEEIKQNVY